MFRTLMVIALSLAAAAPAWATDGVIVQRDSGEVVIDLGANDGLTSGAQVAVYRRLEVIHPVTKKKMEDRFPIGTMIVDEVGATLSIARTWSKLERPPEPGDFVAFTTASVPPPKPADEAAPADIAIETAFRETLGRSLQDRVAIWQDYLRKNPGTPWIGDVLNELQWLRVSIENQRVGVAPSAEVQTPPQPLEPTVNGTIVVPGAVEDGMPVSIDVAAEHPERVDRIRVGVRRRGEPTYEMIELDPTGDFNWSARIKPSAGGGEQLEYFAETIRKDGQTERIHAADSPIVDIRKPAPDPQGSDGRSSAQLLAETVNFNAGAGDDEYSRFEASYRYAVNAYVLSGFRVGVGLFRGTGASLAEIEAGEPSRASLLGYGFAELDFGLAKYFGMNTRLLVGNNQQLGIPESVFENAFGFGGELRFGEQDGTKLLLGASFTETVGAESWIRLEIDAIDRVPLSGEVVVTNLPVGEDLGVSLNFGAGYALTDWFSLLGRVGWNARTIAHHGPTAGLSTVFEW